jgi:hypothetical protein
MIKIVESKVLIRTEGPMPEGFKLATEDFHTGWSVMKSGGTQRLERKVRAKGWSLIRLAEGALRSGVGKSAQEAIANALLLALRRLGNSSNAIEVERVEVTDYPWFCLARLTVIPYRIERQPADLLNPDRRHVVHSGPRQVGMASEALQPYGAFSCVMPMLKQILTSSSNPSPGD